MLMLRLQHTAQLESSLRFRCGERETGTRMERATVRDYGNDPVSFFSPSLSFELDRVYVPVCEIGSA